MSSSQWITEDGRPRQGVNKKRIPLAEWEMHREELLQLYKEKTINQILSIMKEKHGFTPNTRQLVHRLEKWGGRKYNKNKRRLEDDDSSDPDVFLDQTGQRSAPTEAIPGHSSPTAGDLVVEDAVLQNWDFVSSKKALLEGVTRSDLGNLYVGSKLDHSIFRQGLPANSFFFDNKINDWVLQQNVGSPLFQTLERRLTRQDRPADTRPESMFISSICFMRYTADLLFAMGFRCDAFKIYLGLHTLLKDAGAPSWIPGWTKAMCIRSAATYMQFQVLESLIPSATNETADHTSALEHILVHDHVVNPFRFIDLDGGYTPNLLAEYFRRSKPTHLRDLLPTNTRSLDLAFYLHCDRRYCHVRDPDLEWGAKRPSLILDPAERECFKRDLLRCVPGPFEVRDWFVGMENPCLRSCLSWCEAALNPDCCLPEFRNLNTRPIPWYRSNSTYGMFFVLLDMLQEFCNSAREDTLQSMRPERFTWYISAEERLGISPIELLAVICCLFSESCFLDPGDSRPAKVALKRVRELCELTDEELASEFLDAFVSSELKPMNGRHRSSCREIASETRLKLLDSISEMGLDSLCGLSRDGSKSSKPDESSDSKLPAHLPTLSSPLSASELSVALPRERPVPLDDSVPAPEAENIDIPSNFMVSSDIIGNSSILIKEMMACPSICSNSLVSVGELSRMFSGSLSLSHKQSSRVEVPMDYSLENNGNSVANFKIEQTASMLDGNSAVPLPTSELRVGMDQELGLQSN